MYSQYENLKSLVERYNNNEVELSTGMCLEIRFLQLIKNRTSFINLIEDIITLDREELNELSDLVKND
jgi:hypothetical protein